jgi:hypothetical protein
MKSKRFDKKLALNKVTISKLNDVEKKVVLAGGVGGHDTPCTLGGTGCTLYVPCTKTI